MRRTIPLYILIFICCSGFFPTVKSKVAEANRLMKKERYFDAISLYRRAREDAPDRLAIAYNLANAYYKNGDYQKAQEAYTEALEERDASFQADAYYNRGNALFSLKNYTDAIEDYKRTLRIEPDAADAKKALELARRRLKEQMEKQSKEEQDGKKQDDGTQDKNSQRQKDGEQGADQKTKDEERRSTESSKTNQSSNAASNNEGGETNSQSDAGQTNIRPKMISEEEAKRILEALKHDEKERMKEAQQRRQIFRGGSIEKDW